jgi:hypothetical protein
MYKDIPYRNYIVKLKKCVNTNNYEVWVTNGQYFYHDIVKRTLLIEDRNKFLLKCKEIANEGVKRLNKRLERKPMPSYRVAL